MTYPRNRGAILLEAWRRERGLTQFRAGILLGMEPSQVSKIERGDRRPGRTTAVKIFHITDEAVPVEAWDEGTGAATGQD